MKSIVLLGISKGLIIFICWSILPLEAICQATLYPPENSEMNCKMVRFAWNSDGESSVFQLQVSEDRGEPEFDNNVVDRFFSTPATIIRDALEFSSEYIWRIRPIRGVMDTLEWSQIHHFSMINLPDSISNAFETEIHLPDQIQTGYTILSAYGTLLGIDVEGEITWYIPGEPRWWVGSFDVRQLPNGQFQSILQRHVRIFSVNDETKWDSGDFRNISFHHEIYPMPTGTFLGLVSDAHWRVDGEDSTQWGVSNIIEIDREGDIVWQWNFWDHVSREDYDSLLFAQVPPNGHFDWTHCNACPFQESDSTIYLSVRNLNRIIKIAYPSGDIVWNMGLPMQSGNVDFGENLEFYRQHATEPLDNGNLLFFDNHWSLEGDNDYSRALEVEIDPDREEPARIVWEYRHEFGMTQGDADRLPNGNTLITTGSSGNFYEVNSEEELVWEATHDFPYGSYRGERITDFYPQVFCIVGPTDRLLVARWRGTVTYTIYNIGSETGEYLYNLSDSEGWFAEASETIEIAASDSAIITFRGHVPNDENLIDTLRFRAHIVQNNFDVQEWVSVVSPDPATSIDEIGDSRSEFNFTVFGGQSGVSHLSFTLPNSNYVKIVIFDQLGRRVRDVADGWVEKGTHRIDLNVDGFSAGAYYVLFKSKERIITKSLIVVN